MIRMLICTVLLLISSSLVNGASFTFELPDGDVRCFYNFLRQGEHTRVEFQVISGGNFDIDATFRDPFKNTLKTYQREQYNNFDFVAATEGDHALCFSNEFSSVTHKTVYVLWESDSELAKPSTNDNAQSPITLMNTILASIRDNLRKASSAQTKNRLQEVTSRSFIEALNDRVTWRSIVQAIVIVVVAVGQVFLLRSLFKEPTHHTYSNRGANRITPMTVGY